MTDDIKDGETVCKHDKRPFDCNICYPKKLLEFNPYVYDIDGDIIGFKPCCDNEERDMNGGCVNCGDPCL